MHNYDYILFNHYNHISGAMVYVIVLSVVDRGFKPRSSQTKEMRRVFICCFTAKHASLRGENKDWLVRNQENVSEWSDGCFSELALYKSD